MNQAIYAADFANALKLLRMDVAHSPLCLHSGLDLEHEHRELGFLFDQTVVFGLFAADFSDILQQLHQFVLLLVLNPSLTVPFKVM